MSGPVLEKTLNKLGIQSFRQIANFTKADIARVAAVIDKFPDRIDRDDWKGGARAEFKMKYGSKARCATSGLVGSVPAQLVKSGVVDAKVMGNLVQHGLADLGPEGIAG